MAATATALGTVVVVLAGCGGARTPAARPAAAPSEVVGPVGSSSPPAPAPSATVPITAAPAATAMTPASSAATPTATASTSAVVLPTREVAGHPVPVVAPTSFVPATGEAATEFGADKVYAAYQVAREFALRTTFNGGTVLLAKPRRLDVSYADAYLTPAGNKRLDTAVAATGASCSCSPATGTATSRSTASGPGSRTQRRPRPGSPRPTVYKVGGQADRLDIRFQVGGYLLFEKTDGTRQRVLITKDVRYFSVPVDSGGKAGWLVDDWFATINTGLPEVDPTG